MRFLLSADNFRPYITSFQGNNCTDYINAVFVDGYTHPREYIVTEWPLSNTCSDIWDGFQCRLTCQSHSQKTGVEQLAPKPDPLRLV